MANWNDILNEIQGLRDKHAVQAKFAIDIVRRKYLNSLHKVTGRNIIAYYSGFLSKPGMPQLEINDEDKNGFMMCVHKLDRSKGLDLLLHTPGGSISATQSIVHYLHKMFNRDLRAIVPQIAMSAGTMIACACKKILMAKHSNLGPIDPHLKGIPAYGVIEEFKRACKEIAEDKNKIPIWQKIIEQYRPTFLSQCENAIAWSNNFVEEQLKSNMFSDYPEAEIKAKHIVGRLTDYTGNRTHETHLHFEDCKEIGLEVELIEVDSKLQDSVLTVHHCFMHALMNTPSFKIIENHLGTAFVKQQQVQQLMVQK
jgi:hypothetical protein